MGAFCENIFYFHICTTTKISFACAIFGGKYFGRKKNYFSFSKYIHYSLANQLGLHSYDPTIWRCHINIYYKGMPPCNSHPQFNYYSYILVFSNILWTNFPKSLLSWYNFIYHLDQPILIYISQMYQINFKMQTRYLGQQMHPSQFPYSSEKWIPKTALVVQ